MPDTPTGAVAHRTGPGILTFGSAGAEVDFAAPCTSINLTPEVAKGDQTATLGGFTVSEGGETTWKLSGSLYQGFRRTDLIRWCFDNQGAELPFRFTPSTEHSDYDWTGTVAIVPLAIGGDVRKKNTSDFEFTVVGELTPEDHNIGGID